MGLEFRESRHVLGPKNAQPVKAGQVFNVCVGLAGLHDDSVADEALRSYALQLADTVVVKAAGPPEVMTASAPKDFDKISYTLKGDDDEDGDGAVRCKQRGTAAGGGGALGWLVMLWQEESAMTAACGHANDHSIHSPLTLPRAVGNNGTLPSHRRSRAAPRRLTTSPTACPARSCAPTTPTTRAPTKSGALLRLPTVYCARALRALCALRLVV